MSAIEPAPVTGPHVWEASDFPRPRAWARALTDTMLAEIDDAMRGVRARGLAYWDIAKADFPLPEASVHLAAALEDLEGGRGFAVLSGFPVGRYSYEESLLAYAGLAAHLGRIVEQTHKGDRIIDVRDEGLPYDHRTRGYGSSERLPFHTDGADIAALLCLGTAAEGGQSVLVSGAAVHNRLLAERPDLMDVYRRGFHHHRRGEEAPGEPPVSAARIPVFAAHGGLLHCCYNRNPIDWAVREGVTLEAREVEALDALDAVTARPEMQLAMDLAPGDVQLVNNYAVLHSRAHYRDDARHRRHLARMWLHAHETRWAGPTILNLYAPHVARQRLAG